LLSEVVMESLGRWAARLRGRIKFKFRLAYSHRA